MSFGAVLFDLDDTLLPFDLGHRAGLEAAASCLQPEVSAASFGAAYQRARAAVKQRTAGSAASHDRLLYAAELCAAQGLGPTRALEVGEAYWAAYLAAVEPPAAMVELIKALRTTGVRTAVVTNLTTRSQLRKVQRLASFGASFDAVVTSEEAGAEKPALAPFQLVCARLKVPPSNCLFVGDAQRDDMAGGAAAGMGSLVLIDPQDPPSLHGEHVVTTAAGAAELIRQLVLAS